MRWQPGRSPEEGATLSTADAPSRRTFATGRRRGRRRRGGSLFAASAGSSALSPLPPSSPSSPDGTRASGSGGPAIAPASSQLSGLVALGPRYLRLNLLTPAQRSKSESPKDVAMNERDLMCHCEVQCPTPQENLPGRRRRFLRGIASTLKIFSVSGLGAVISNVYLKRRVVAVAERLRTMDTAFTEHNRTCRGCRTCLLRSADVAVSSGKFGADTEISLNQIRRTASRLHVHVGFLDL